MEDLRMDTMETTETQIELEKKDFEKEEKQLQIELEILEDAMAFRQEIMESDLKKQLMDLKTMINQVKIANESIIKEINTLRINLKNKSTPNFEYFNPRGSTPEIMGRDLFQYATNNVVNTNENTLNSSPKIFTAANINLGQDKSVPKGNCSIKPPGISMTPKSNSFDINVKRVTVARVPTYMSVPDTKKSKLISTKSSINPSVTSIITKSKSLDRSPKKTVASVPYTIKANLNKYMPLPITVPKSEPIIKISNTKKKRNTISQKIIIENDKEFSKETIPSLESTHEAPKRKKRRLYNPDTDFDHLKKLLEEDR